MVIQCGRGMSSGTVCITACGVVSKLCLSKGHAGKTQSLNLTLGKCWRDLWLTLCKSPELQQLGVVWLPEELVGAPGCPQEWWLAGHSCVTDKEVTPVAAPWHSSMV